MRKVWEGGDSYGTGSKGGSAPTSSADLVEPQPIPGVSLTLRWQVLCRSQHNRGSKKNDRDVYKPELC